MPGQPLQFTAATQHFTLHATPTHQPVPVGGQCTPIALARLALRLGCLVEFLSQRSQNRLTLRRLSHTRRNVRFDGHNTLSHLAQRLNALLHLDLAGLQPVASLPQTVQAFGTLAQRLLGALQLHASGAHVALQAGPLLLGLLQRQRAAALRQTTLHIVHLSGQRLHVAPGFVQQRHVAHQRLGQLQIGARLGQRHLQILRVRCDSGQARFGGAESGFLARNLRRAQRTDAIVVTGQTEQRLVFALFGVQLALGGRQFVGQTAQLVVHLGGEIVTLRGCHVLVAERTARIGGHFLHILGVEDLRCVEGAVIQLQFVDGRLLSARHYNYVNILLNKFGVNSPSRVPQHRHTPATGTAHTNAPRLRTTLFRHAAIRRAASGA